MGKWVAAIAALCVWGSSGLIDEVAAAGPPPVVLITFDAFPTNSLRDANGRIDRARYPTFARLAADSTWYPYATTSLDETGRALRSIFTGRASWRWAKPSYAKLQELRERFHTWHGKKG